MLVLAVLTVSYASSLRRLPRSSAAHINDLKTQIAEHEANIDSLEAEKDRWEDPAYVAQQARERLGYVMPGEKTYLVLGEDGKPLEPASDLARPRHRHLDDADALVERRAGRRSSWPATRRRPASRRPPRSTAPRRAPAARAPRGRPPKHRDLVVRPAESDLEAVGRQLGATRARRARGRAPLPLRAARRGDHRAPAADGTPFPTTFYLTCPRAASRIGSLEGSGLMKEMEARLGTDPELAAAYAGAHERYLAARAASWADVPEIDGISAGGMPDRVKCLHVLAGAVARPGPRA